MSTLLGLLGLLPIVVFAILVFKEWNPVAAVGTSMVLAAIMAGKGVSDIALGIREGLGAFIGYVGLIIMFGGGLGRIAEKTGAARKIVQFVMHRVGINTPNKAIIGTLICSTTMIGLLGTLAGANAVVAPVIIPIVAAAGLSSSAVAVIFKGGVTGLFLGPFTPPMVTLMGLTGLSYPQVVMYAGLPISIIIWITTFFFVKRILPKTLETHPYPEEVLLTEDGGELTEKEDKIANQATLVFLASLIGLMIYGIYIKGGADFAVFVITATAVTTGLAGRMHINEVAKTFIEGATPLLWIFIQFVLFTPFINFIEDTGGFEAVKNLLMPLIEAGGEVAFIIASTLISVVGIPGSANAQKVVIHELFLPMVESMSIPMNIWVLVLLVGSQITAFLYPTGDTLGAMGIARSDDIRSMIIFGIICTILTVLYVTIRAIFFF